MLYLVATPIGNLKEITYRAVETLNDVDYILCEDTSRSIVLLNAYNIKKPLKSHHKFNEAATIPLIIQDLREGKNIALISDAGMPCISDPGGRLVAALAESGLEYTVISGPSAVVSAVALSGFSCPRFLFLGFLPEKNKDREELIKKYIQTDALLVLYAAPHDILKDLDFLFKHLGSRKATVVREISKIHESVQRIVLGCVDGINTRGEMVIVIEPPEFADKNLSLTLEEHLSLLIADGMDKKSAIKTVAKARGLNRNDVYKLTFKEN